MPTEAPTANPQPQDNHPPLSTILNLLIGIIPTIAALILIMMSPEINTRLQVAAVWLLCTVLFALADLLAERIENGGWAGYLNMVVMVAWLCVGLLAFGVIVAGVALASTARMRFARDLKLPLLSTGEVFKRSGLRFIISGLSLLTAVVVYYLLGAAIPLRRIDQENAAPLTAALAVGFLTSQIVGVALARFVSHTAARPIWSSSKRAEWLSELSYFPLIVTMPLILFDAGLGAFMVIMSIVGAHAVRYRQIALEGAFIERSHRTIACGGGDGDRAYRRRPRARPVCDRRESQVAV